MKHPVKAPPAYAVLDRPRPETHRKQLSACEHTMLASRELGDYLID